MKNIGNKAKNLIWLKENGFPIPDFLIVDPRDIIANYDEIKNCSDLSSVKWIEENIDKYLKFKGKEVAFRTSSFLEDTEKHSFAGLYETFLNITLTKNNFKKYIFLCIRGLFSEKVISYFKINNFDTSKLGCSIIIQEMFYPTFSGVAFMYEKDKDSKLVYSKGFCKKIVDGGNANSVQIDNISDDFKSINYSKELLDCLKKVYKLKGCPQDIEWGISDKYFCFLQTRNITKDIIFRDEKFEIYDCTNISESYPGITLPLTYSFINYLYSKVYISFLSIFGIRGVIRYKDVFDNMLGYIDGRVYYNIANWYNFLKILPGYKYNKEFFEAMLVPKKNIKSEKEKKFKTPFFINFFILVKLFFKLFFYKNDHQEFIKKFNHKYEQHKEKNLSKMSNKDIFNYYERLRDSFLDDWKIPIMNDFRLMVFHGLLKKISREDTLNEMMSGFAKDQYFEIIREISKLSSIVNCNNELKSIFSQKDNKKIYDGIMKGDGVDIVNFREKLHFYLNNFYYRRPGELKLESDDIGDNPEMIISLIKSYPKEIKNKKKKLKISNPFIRLIAEKTRDAIRNREIFRAKRAMVFGVAKDCFITIAHNFKSSDIIEEKKDIFFLNTEEIKSIINRNTADNYYKELIKQRKRKIDEYKFVIWPDRIKIYEYGKKRVVLDDTIEIKDNLKGLPVSQGVFRGRALVLEKFRTDVDYKDKILVTYQTDPGWSIVFPLLKGVILERGNTLSHASILSREMEIPSIVKVKNAVSMLKDGQLIELNGNNGEVKIIKE